MLKQLDTLIGFVVVMTVVSLLITIITQTISGLVNLRGRNLVSALKLMFVSIGSNVNPPITVEAAEKLAIEVLTHPLISDSVLGKVDENKKSGWLGTERQKLRAASAIRPDELYSIVQKISDDNTDQTLKASATIFLAGLGTVAPTPLITAMQDHVATLVDQEKKAGEAVIQSVKNSTQLTKLEKWFNSSQDRAIQWFATYTRTITIICAIITAFVLQLDTIELLKQISTDSDLRDKLVSNSKTIQGLATDVLNDEQSKAVTQPVHKEAVSKLSDKYKTLPDGLDKHDGDFPSIDTAKAWVSDNLKKEEPKRDHSEDDAIANDYEQEVRIAKLNENLELVKKVSGASGLQLMPSPYPMPFHHPAKGDGWCSPFPHFLGILISAALLGLGAPFWFNMLKTLTNLRPLLADNVQSQPTQTPVKKEST